MFGNNIKVHFAGIDNGEWACASLLAADVEYSLYSCYKYIIGKQPDADFRLPKNHAIYMQCQENRHVIQDSGLFTMLFGAEEGKRQTLQSLMRYQDALIEFVKQNQLNATIVELDCQKIIGTKGAWFLRERMRDRLKNRQINVWHFQDGMKGLDRMIEFTDYIAIGVSEWRIVKKGSHREDIRYITHYIKNKKPEIDIHLLGCTDVKILEENKFCTSADSTSWLSGIRYGYINDGFKHDHVKNFKPDIVQKREAQVKAILDSRNKTLSPNMLRIATNASICATIHKQRYTRAAGSQD